MFFKYLKTSTTVGFYQFIQKITQNVQKIFFFTKKVCFRGLCLCRFHVFQKVEKVLLRLTAQRKTSKIMKILFFLQRFSLEIAII